MLDGVLESVDSQLADMHRKGVEDTLIRLWDAEWNCVMTIEGEYSHSFKFLNNDAGEATLELPLDHPVVDVLGDVDSWPTKSMYLTFDRNDGAVRWSGRIENYRVSVDNLGESQIEISAVHDYKKLKELLVWANPFLPAEVQFPKAWFLFGPSRWAVTVTLFVNLLRKNNSLWMLPDNPVDVRQWFDLDQSNWNIAVKGVDYGRDYTVPATVSSRFKYFHDCVKDVCEDAQLSIRVRRYLKGEDPLPWDGAKLRHGCLVVDVVPMYEVDQSTAWGGNLLKGLVHGIRRIADDGLTEHVDWVKDPNYPEEYSRQWFRGTLPQAPWVTLVDGEHTGMSASEFEYTPPGAVQTVTGGSSMPGVNEGLKAAIIGIGGVIGSAFNQSQIGAVAESVLEPLYTDVFAAFMAWKDHKRIREHGWDFPFEKWADGSDKAYTLSAVTTLRASRLEDRERFSVEVTLDNGSPYWVGEDFFIGDRVAVHAKGMPEGKLMVQQVEELEFVSSSDERGWTIQVGKPEFDSGFDFLARKYEEMTAGWKELGVW